MTQLNAYLFFDGHCAEAMRFYERTLGGRIEMMMTHGEIPASDRQPGQDDARIVHARLAGDGMVLMASDWMAGQAFPGASGFSLSLGYPTVAQARAIFDALADGGDVRMPFGKTFWSPGFGMLADRYGTPWMVSGESD
ncbi:MAG TPA: VOC family protein [Solimonas sp.]|nr:VOC family protein [Solimonas sp.]